MLKFLLRRFANYLVLVVLATCMGYFLAASALHPRQIYEGRNPPPPEASIDKTLDDLFTASFGVCASTSPAEPADALLGRADELLYQSKTNGRNRVTGV